MSKADLKMEKEANEFAMCLLMPEETRRKMSINNGMKKRKI